MSATRQLIKQTSLGVQPGIEDFDVIDRGPCPDVGGTVCIAIADAAWPGGCGGAAGCAGSSGDFMAGSSCFNCLACGTKKVRHRERIVITHMFIHTEEAPH